MARKSQNTGRTPDQQAAFVEEVLTGLPFECECIHMSAWRVYVPMVTYPAMQNAVNNEVDNRRYVLMPRYFTCQFLECKAPEDIMLLIMAKLYAIGHEHGKGEVQSNLRDLLGMGKLQQEVLDGEVVTSVHSSY